MAVAEWESPGFNYIILQFLGLCSSIKAIKKLYCNNIEEAKQ